MTIDELNKQYREKSDAIVEKRKIGGFKSEAEDIQEQSDLWVWYLVRNLKSLAIKQT
jgi:hypothetical protein